MSWRYKGGIVQAYFNPTAVTYGLYGIGWNYNGSVGDSTAIDRSSPVQIDSSTTWSKVCGGVNSVSGLTTSNTLWTWGSNNYGQLGQSTSYLVARSSPTQVGALTTWINIACSNYNTYAIKSDGTLWSWGRNSTGSVGDGTAISRSSPIQIGNLTTWSTPFSMNTNSGAAIKTDNTLWVWGYNLYGQLGVNDTISRSSPVQLASNTNWSSICGGNQFTIGLKTDGTLWSWGLNDSGQLGKGDVINRSSPVQIGGLTTWSQIGSVFATSLAIKTDGTLWAWGSNNYGSVGDGTTINRSSPVQIGTLTNWKRIVSGVYGVNSAAIDTSNNLWCWGSNGYGQLGQGNKVYRSSPVQFGSRSYQWSNGTMTAGGFSLIAVG